MTAALKLFGPIYLVLPGIIAVVLFAGQGIRADHAYGWLVHEVFPAPMTGYFVSPFDQMVAQMHDVHFLGVVFAYLVVFMLVMGHIHPRSEEFVQVDVKAVDLTPWRHAGVASVVLIVLVLAIYVAFADFSVLSQ